ncbi:MAG: helix-turn-helix domain-containing protein [Fibrobacteres bacterium]|nr:helix-turn-helix domain-containing protein [Fibrobacterota bacterium]
MPHAVVGFKTGPHIQLTIDGRAPIEIKSGGGYFVPPGSSVSSVYKRDGEVFIRWGHIGYRVMEYVDLFSLYKIPFAFSSADGKVISEILSELQSLKSSRLQSAYDIVQMQMCGFKLLEILLKEAVPLKNEKTFVINMPRLNDALQFINDNIAKQITRTILASKLFLSEVRLHTLFKECFGVAPMEYVTQIRVRKAQEMLYSKSESIEQIGASVGYPDQFHFSKLFKHHTGLSPSRYRLKSRTEFSIPSQHIN